MKKFIKKHPVLENSLDIILSLMAGSFALFAIIIVWINEVISKHKNK